MQIILLIVGSPYAMLLHSVGADVNLDDTFCKKKEQFKCYTERFEEENILLNLNPFNSKNNMGIYIMYIIQNLKNILILEIIA